MAQSSVLLLGPFQVQHHATTVMALRRAKAAALLAYLAVEADRPHPRSGLAGLLWPEQPEEQALRNLSQALVQLRQALADGEDPLLVTRQTVQWRDGAAAVDVHAFLRLAGSDAMADLEQAAALYRGEFLAGFGLPECEAFEDWLLLTRERLGHQALDVLQRLGEAYLAVGQLTEAVAASRRQLGLDPWREVAYRQLMRALAQSGDRAGALAAYARCQKVLADELDITPDEETRLLAKRIEAGDVPAPGERLVPATEPTRTHNLPAPLASLVGREDELAHLATLAQSDTRLVTVVGAGGSGKSRLALAAAWQLRSQFPDGVWWVELAGIGAGDDPPAERATVASAVAAALGATLTGRRPLLDELAGVLAERNALLVLDNCEHLPETATVARTLLESSLGLCLLTTSRERLGLSGEALLPLEGLAVPDEGEPDAGAYPAVRLFVERAARRTPDWGQGPGEVEAAGRFCRLLEGMPLGIELAAHWVGHYAPDEIAAALQTDLDSLAARTHDVPERQRSLRAVFAHSWSLLSEAEQQALTRLSVFRGGVDRAAAQAVAGIAATTLATLVDKSLLRRVEVGRYGLHELLRQFAAERLDAVAEERAEVQAQHGAYFLSMAEEAAAEYGGSRQVEWLDRVQRDHDNIRAAQEGFGARGDVEMELRLAAATVYFWFIRGYHTEGAERLLRTLARPEAQHRTAVRARALNAAGYIQWVRGNLPEAHELFAESVGITRAVGTQQDLAFGLCYLGTVLNAAREYHAAESLLEESLAIWDALGNHTHMCLALMFLGDSALGRGDWQRALLASTRSAELCRSTGNISVLPYPLRRLGYLALLEHDEERATALYFEAMVVNREVGDRQGVAASLVGLAAVAEAREQPEESAVLLGAAEALVKSIESQLLPFDAEEYERVTAIARSRLDAAMFAAAWATGRAMKYDQAVIAATEWATPIEAPGLRNLPQAAPGRF
jgi:predicted ATPase/DNA-binding SARP family transcriptional activator